jgi:hypothetical protein
MLAWCLVDARVFDVVGSGSRILHVSSSVALNVLWVFEDEREKEGYNEYLDKNGDNFISEGNVWQRAADWLEPEPKALEYRILVALLRLELDV